MRNRNTSQTRKMLGIVLFLLLSIAIGIAIIYLYFSNSLSSALATSLGNLHVVSVTYPIITPDLVELNIALTLNNTSGFALTVEAITLSFFIEEKSIGEISVPLDETIPAGANHYFHSVQNITDTGVLQSIREPTYVLRINGEIRGMARFLFIQASDDKRLNFSKLVDGIPEPSLK